jgi:hypothetical protein
MLECAALFRGESHCTSPGNAGTSTARSSRNGITFSFCAVFSVSSSSSSSLSYFASSASLSSSSFHQSIMMHLSSICSFFRPPPLLYCLTFFFFFFFFLSPTIFCVWCGLCTCPCERVHACVRILCFLFFSFSLHTRLHRGQTPRWSSWISRETKSVIQAPRLSAPACDCTFLLTAKPHSLSLNLTCTHTFTHTHTHTLSLSCTHAHSCTPSKTLTPSQTLTPTPTHR